MYQLHTLYSDLPEILAAQLQMLKGETDVAYSRACHDLTRFMRTAGVAALLLELDVAEYCDYLARSGITRLRLLRNESTRLSVSRFAKITNAASFLDVVATEHWRLSQQIVEASPTRWDQRYEYEDDFCYIRFLHGAVTDAPEAVQGEILDRFETVLDGEKSVRLTVCQSLLATDSEAFSAAMEAFVENWQREIEFQSSSIGRDEVRFVADQYVSVEALALLKIAARLQLDLPGELDFCPADARTAVGERLPDTGFPE